MKELIKICSDISLLNSAIATNNAGIYKKAISRIEKAMGIIFPCYVADNMSIEMAGKAHMENIDVLLKKMEGINERPNKT